MRFLIDAQLPPSLAVFLREAGFDAEHVVDVGLLNETDRTIAAHAVKSDAVVITKDEDFVLMRRFRRKAPQVVWIRSGNVTNRALTAMLRPVLPEIVAALEAGEGIVEVR